MYLKDLPIVTNFFPSQKRVDSAQYYAIEKDNVPALIFLCLISDNLTVTPTEEDDCIHAHYKCYPIQKGISKDTILTLQKKCRDDYNSFVHRGRVTVSGYTDLSVLSTKFKTRK